MLGSAVIGRAARAGTWYGAMWSLVIGLNFYFISSPLIFEPVFDESLRLALICTTVACVLSLPRLRMPRVPWSVVAFLAFAFATSFWSIDQSFTIHFLGLYVVLTMLAMVVAGNVETRVLSHGLMLGGVILMATSIYALWQELPGADVPADSSGYLAGVGTNRNILAYTMILSLGFAVSFVPRRWWTRVGWSFAVILILSGIILTESATGIAASAVLIATVLVLGSRDRLVALGRPPGWRYWAVLTGILVAVTATCFAWYESLRRDLQRDFSLTGRVQIWESVWEAISTRTRIIGDGWGSVWPHPWRPSMPNGEFKEIVQHLGIYVAHGHNSAMDLLPEVGLVGVTLFGFIYVHPLVRALRWRRGTSTPAAREAGRVAILGVLALVLAGVTEPISTIPLGFYVAVLIAAHVPPEPAESSAVAEPAQDS